MIACWCRLCGDRAAGLVAVVAFVFTLQAHVGMGLVVTPLAVATAGVCCRGRVRSPDAARHRSRGVAVGAALTVVLFLPVLVDTARHWPGNAWTLLDWSLTNDDPAVGASRALRAVGRATSFTSLLDPGVPSFVTVTEPVALGLVPGVAVLLVVAGAIVSWRRGYRAELLLTASLVLSWAAAAVATVSIRGLFLAWLLSSVAPLAWLSWGAIGLVADRGGDGPDDQRGSDLVPSGRHRARPLSLLLVIPYIRDTADGDTVFVEEAATIEQFSAAAHPVADDGPVRVHFAGDPEIAGPVQAGLVNRLDAMGDEPRVAERFVLQFGRSRVDEGALPVLLVRNEPVTMPAPDDAVVLAVADPLTPQGRAEVDDLTARLDEVVAASGADGDVRALLATVFAEVVLTRVTGRRSAPSAATSPVSASCAAAGATATASCSTSSGDRPSWLGLSRSSTTPCRSAGRSAHRARRGLADVGQCGDHGGSGRARQRPDLDDRCRARGPCALDEPTQRVEPGVVERPGGGDHHVAVDHRDGDDRVGDR